MAFEDLGTLVAIAFSGIVAIISGIILGWRKQGRNWIGVFVCVAAISILATMTIVYLADWYGWHKQWEYIQSEIRGAAVASQRPLSDGDIEYHLKYAGSMEADLILRHFKFPFISVLQASMILALITAGLAVGIQRLTYKIRNSGRQPQGFPIVPEK
jgi:hypothetical protein